MRVNRLHLGCFDRPVSGWTNTDVTPHLFVARIPLAASFLHRAGRMTDERYRQHQRGVFGKVHYLNVGKRFPIASGSVDAVFSSHMLEHLPPDVAKQCLSECYRVLRRGGVLRSGVPDLDVWLSRYDKANPDPIVDAIFETRLNNGKNRHYWMYNEVSLRERLSDAGFTETKRVSFGEGKCPDLDRLDNRPAETLFVEAYKA